MSVDNYARGIYLLVSDKILPLIHYELLLFGKSKLKTLYLFIHRYCSSFTHSGAWFSVSTCEHYKMHLFRQK